MQHGQTSIRTRLASSGNIIKPVYGLIELRAGLKMHFLNRGPFSRKSTVVIGRCTQGVDIQMIGDYVSRRHVCIDMQRYETRVYRHENASSDIKVQGVPVIGNRKQLVLPWQIIQIGPDLEPLFVLTVGDSFASSTDGIWSIRLGALTAKQSRAIIAVLMCGSVKKAAELCGIKRTTFGRHLGTALGREARERELSLNFNAIPEPVHDPV